MNYQLSPAVYWMVYLLIASSFAVATWAFGLAPAEDAAILFNYSDNLSSTGVISYYPDGPRAEGATDFLWMIILAFFDLLGLEIFASATALCGLGLLAITYTFSKLAAPNSLAAMLVLFLFLLAAPGAFSSAVGFSTTFFFGAIAVAIHLLPRPSSRAFFLSCTVLALVRPEGLFVAGYLGALRLFHFRDSIRRERLTLLVGFAMPVLAYLGWRAVYFDQLLPLPLKMKVGIPHGLSYLASNALLFSAITVVLFIVVMVREGNAKRKVIAASFFGVHVLFFAMYALSFLMQNIYDRFLFFAPFTALGMACLGFSSSRSSTRLVGVASLLIMLISQSLNPVLLHYIKDAVRYRNIATASIAKDLAPYGAGMQALITESGLFAYHSKWKVVDAWGLNTKAFTTEAISSDFVRENQFDVVLLHAASDRLNPAQAKTTHACELWYEGEDFRQTPKMRWRNMVSSILNGLERDDYSLFFVSYTEAPKPKDLHTGRYDCYFVRKTSSFFGDVVRVLRAHHAIPARAVHQHRRVLRSE